MQTAMVLWTSTRTHKLMREFLWDKFQQYVKVAPTFILHLFESRVPALMMTDMRQVGAHELSPGGCREGADFCKNEFR
jgi:hypothetical protein